MGVVLRSTPVSAVSSVPVSDLAAVSVVSTYLRLVALCQQQNMAECGMLQYYDSTLGAKLFKQSNVPLLAGSHCYFFLSGTIFVSHKIVDYFCRIATELVSTVMEQNALEVATNCLRTIVTYFNNIIKVKELFSPPHYIFFSPKFLFLPHCQDPTERKYQTIKLSNSVLQQNVLQAHGGIALLLFGPAAFTLTISSLSASLGQQVVQSALASEILQADKSTSFRTRYVAWLRQYVGFLNAAMETVAN